MSERKLGCSTPRVFVAMATYNGQEYVLEQIESILGQRGVDVELFISDDGSSDLTLQICGNIASRHDNVVFRQNSSNKGACANFMSMIYEVDANAYDYYAFSDQDDVWLPDKLEHSISCIKALGYSDVPCLYYSDVTNVNATLENARREYYLFANKTASLKTLLLCNWAMGCTMVFNGQFCKLLQKSAGVEPKRMHDAWAHLVAMACEKARIVPDLQDSRILRRITGNNTIGERKLDKFEWRRVLERASNVFSHSEHTMTECASQLIFTYDDELSPETRKIVIEFASSKYSFRSRLRLCFDAGYWTPSLIERVVVGLKFLAGKW